MTSHDPTRDLDARFDHSQLAREAGYSVAQTYRRAAADGIRKPMSARRRVLLERAAYFLVRDGAAVGEIAVRSGFDSPDGFARAFRRHYGVAPSVFRRLRVTEFRCGTRGGLHYNPGPWEVVRQGATMTLIHRLLQNNHDQTLEVLASLERHPEVHDTMLPLTNPFPWDWEPDDETVLQLANRCASGPEPWLHAIEGYESAKWDGRLESIRPRLDSLHERFMRLVASIEEDGTWETTFVDADCDPPQVFSYGSVVHHVISFNEHARITLIQRLRALELSEDEPRLPTS